MPSTHRPPLRRPRSPNIQHYAPQLTSVLSITHRLTGVLLSLAAILLVVALLCLAFSPATWSSLQAALASWPGQALLLFFTFAYFYHLLNGIRHLFWDVHLGFSLPVVYRSGWLVLFGSLLLTLGTWLLSLNLGGGA